MKIHCGIVSLTCVFLGLETCDLQAQSSPYTVEIERKMIATPIKADGLTGDFTARLSLEANGLGELKGTGSFFMNYFNEGRKIYEGKIEEFPVQGRFIGKTLAVIGPKSILMRSIKKGPDVEGIDKTTTPFPEWKSQDGKQDLTLNRFRGTLASDPENPSGPEKFKEVTHYTGPVSNFEITTIMRGRLPVVNTDIPVAVQHPILPALYMKNQTAFIKNQVTFVLPKSVQFPEDKRFKVRAYLDRLGFRLWLDGDETKKRELRFDNVKPGEKVTFNYSWADPPADLPKNAAYKERVVVEVEGTKIHGHVDFDVGIAFKIMAIKQPEEDMKLRAQRRLTTATPYDLRVAVIDAFHPDIDVSALANRFALEPVLTLKQTDYLAGVDLLDVVTTQSPGKFLEFWSQKKYSLKPGNTPPTLITGNNVSFKVVEAGKDFILHNPGGVVPYPQFEFRTLGAHTFEASIDKVYYQATPFDSSPAKKRKVMWCLYDYGGAQKEVYEVLLPCLETVMAAEGALENPIEYGQQLGECIKKLKESLKKNEAK